MGPQGTLAGEKKKAYTSLLSSGYKISESQDATYKLKGLFSSYSLGLRKIKSQTAFHISKKGSVSAAYKTYTRNFL